MDMEGLSVICAGLGLADEDGKGNQIGYSTGEYCLDNLKDLLRFLRRDDPQSREVFKQVCKWNIVSKDLIPIIEYCQNDRNLVLNAVKVLVFLTMPIEASSNDIPQQVEYLWGLKSAITVSDTVAVIVSFLERPLENLECDAFTEDDWKLVQLVLTLFRNILAIQDLPPQQNVGGSACELLSLRDRFMELLFKENVMDIIIIVAQHVGGHFRQDNLLLLETFHYIFVGQNPELIAKIHQEDHKIGVVTKDSLDSLKSIMAEEEEKRKLLRLQSAIRHSQFSGTFARPTMDGSKAVIKGNPNNTILKPHKGHKGVNKKIVWDNGGLSSTKDNVLVLLHDFVNQFLSGSYNVLMKSIRQDIEKEHHAIQNSDIVIFFRVAQFVTSFQYHKISSSEPSKEKDSSEVSTDEFAGSTIFNGNICGPIASTMDDLMFQLVTSRWRLAFDGLKETKDYKYLSAAGSLMKTMIRMLDLVLKLLPEDSKEPQTARILLYKLFYDQTEEGMTQFLLSLIKAFDTNRQLKSDLADLVEMVGVLVRLMEKLQARGTLRVSRKSRKGKKKVGLKDGKEAHGEEKREVVKGEKEADVEEKREVVKGEKEADDEEKREVVKGEKEADGEELSEVLNGEEEANEGNREAVMGETETNGEWNGEVVRGEKDAENTVDNAVLDGENNVSQINDNNQNKICLSDGEQVEDSSMLQKENLTNATSGGEKNMTSPTHIDEPEKLVSDSGDFGVNNPQMDKEKSGHEENNLDLSSSDSEDEGPAARDEVDFKVSTYISAFANCSIIQKLCWLLKFYKSNSIRTNHYILCILRTITDDLELAPMLYQLSLLTTFNEILTEQKSCPCKDYANIVDFLTRFVRNMLKKMKSQPLLFVEILFWKTRKECHYINAEYMLHELGNVKKSTGKGNYASEIGEPGSSQATEWTRRSIADALGEDEADVVITHGLQDQNDMQEEDPSGSNNGTERGEYEVPKRKRRLVLNDEWDTKIKDLYDTFKDDPNCIRRIAESLDHEGKVSAAQVSNKLKQLGLQLAPRKRAHMSVEAHTIDPDHTEEEKIMAESRNLQDNSEDPEASISRKPLNKRKRVQAIGKDQEAKIIALYEQFKNHKRCSFMIANALDDGNKFSSAQISRKLKQLGLHVQKKKSEDHTHLRDEAPNDTNVNESHDSDDETLLSFKKRRKSKNDSSSFAEKHSLKNMEKEMSADSDDDEPLSNILQKPKKLNPEPEDDRLQTLLAKGLSEDSVADTTKDVTERDDNNSNQSSEEVAAGNSENKRYNLEDTSETEMDDISPGVLPVNDVDDEPEQMLDDDVAELEDDLVPTESITDAATRRRLRLIIDAEDDED